MASILAQFYLLLLIALCMAMLLIGINAEPYRGGAKNTIFQGPGRDTGYLNYS
jgi:hypothetical protein